LDAQNRFKSVERDGFPESLKDKIILRQKLIVAARRAENRVEAARHRHGEKGLMADKEKDKKATPAAKKAAPAKAASTAKAVTETFSLPG